MFSIELPTEKEEIRLFDISRESKLKFALLRCQKPGNQECKLQFATEAEYFTRIIKEPKKINYNRKKMIMNRFIYKEVKGGVAMGSNTCILAYYLM